MFVFQLHSIFPTERRCFLSATISAAHLHIFSDGQCTGMTEPGSKNGTRLRSFDWTELFDKDDRAHHLCPPDLLPCPKPPSSCLLTVLEHCLTTKP
ncbi:unnamed protein product [Fusarium graminearum]|nr:unnamed protein product [Fusarium graminearum]